jgi:environmental stress-induced protein Ves
MPHILRADEHRAMPWANGAGVTYQVATFPEVADLSTFSWRISMADVPEDGPFSAFPGVDRILTVLGPGDLRLFVNDEELLAPRHVPIAFSGDDVVRAELINGPITDLNVMTRRGNCTATVQVHQGSEPITLEPLPDLTQVIVILDGAVTLLDDDLGPRDVVFIREGTHLSGDGHFALITITEI